jgi:hypothetical protein
MSQALNPSSDPSLPADGTAQDRELDRLISRIQRLAGSRNLAGNSPSLASAAPATVGGGGYRGYDEACVVPEPSSSPAFAVAEFAGAAREATGALASDVTAEPLQTGLQSGLIAPQPHDASAQAHSTLLPVSAPATPANAAAPGGTTSQPAALSARKTCSFGQVTTDRDEPFVPYAPASLEAAGLNATTTEELICRFLLNRGEAPGRGIAEQLRLPFRLIDPILNRLKLEQITVYRGATSVNDYIHSLTDQGRDRARRYMLRTTYHGSAPVKLSDYYQAVALQSIEGQHPGAQDLELAFKDLLVSPAMLSKLGPAVNSGRGMFLFGAPGNGKTSIAERITAAFGRYIWIPRALQVDGEILRLYDPLMHEEVEPPRSTGLVDNSPYDRRWVRIKRPTIVAGGELTMEMLEVQRDASSNISEAPLQLKSNCGVLLIDDFGRQKMRVDELLNRWIVPLEKRFDFLNMSSGKKVQVPFDQLVVFSTNLQPKDLVDDAFLRRIPYKIEVADPTETAFRRLFEIMAPKLGIPYCGAAVDYLIAEHYVKVGRPFRNCHPRDLLMQVRNYCLFHAQPLEMSNERFDVACDNYFSIM